MNDAMRLDIARQALALLDAGETVLTPGARDLFHTWADDLRPFDPMLADRLAAL